jgi:NADH:ubiquinone oxidoreductase subunit 3 (subunit A)
MVLLRKIFGLKRNQIAAEWKNLKMTSFIVVLLVTYYWMIKSRMMGWAGHVTRMG